MTQKKQTLEQRLRRKLLSLALLAAMLVALPLARLELFWTCLGVYLLLWGSWWLLRRYYWERM